MRFEDLKAALQPSVDRDLREVYDRFLAQGGKKSLDAFLSWLVQEGLLSEEERASVAQDLRSSIARRKSGTMTLTDDERPARTKGGTGTTGRTQARGTTGATRKTGTGARERGRSESGLRRRRPPTGSNASSEKKPTPPPPKLEVYLPAERRYDFVGVVGAGAMGQVDLAYDKLLHRRVAFKKITEKMAKHGTMASKFQMEAQITAQLDHPNIVPVYTLERSPEDLAAYTMKLVKGRTLEDMIVDGIELHRKRQPPPDELSEEKLLEYFLKVCDAISYAHSRGVVHRDLKPENIMVGAYGEIYVMDWGISRPFTQDVDAPVEVGKLEDEGDLVIGTPQYMSPEQAEGDNKNLDHRSDQYSLGLILFELISFNQAVTGKTPMKIVMRQQDGEKNPLVHVNPAISIALELQAIVAKATQKKRDLRYADVNELAADVRRYMRGEAVLAKRDTPWQALMRFMRRHQRLTLAFILALIATSVFSLLIVAGVYQWRLSQQRVREGLVSQLLTRVSAQTSLIDGQFLKYEGLLSVLAVTATDLLERDLEADPEAGEEDLLGEIEVYFDDDFAPPDLEPSERYGMPISLEDPVVVLAPHLSAHDVQATLARLQPMQRHYYKVMLRSLSEDAAVMGPTRARRAISEVGVPLAWTYTATVDGVYSAYPGHEGFPSSFDPRSRPWYELAAQHTGPTWGAPHGDVSGMGLILSCAQSLRTHEGELLGVAGLDVTFDFLIEELLEIDGFANISEAFLLDRHGKIVVQSSRKGQKVAATGRELRMQTFPIPKVVAAIEKLRSGYVETPSGEIVVYHRMNSLGWYYVVKGRTGALLRATARSE